ncbi:granzyme-like protein 1 [Pimephales promelas]|uniref:granzyme-like protein 1 n=1 Tax=Pimephales promelas TaxID=90988 RepID=UPI001955F495|nr:granzyme-like protein 1 [Pimephales promelas]
MRQHFCSILSVTELSTMSILWYITGLLLLRSCTPGFSMHDGIVGGKVSIPHSRPYMVYIRDSQSKAVCDGFLVREDFVMTAAHCKYSHLKVYLGVNDTNFLPDGVAVDPIPHPHFINNKPGHDIMLLKLKTPATLNKTVKTVPLPEKESHKHCMVMGWGLLGYHDASHPSKVLREANVTLLDSKNCGTKDTLCSAGKIGPAMGDSGGPLVCGDVAQGIVSYYRLESNGDHCSRYTDISKYLPWIHDKMKPPTPQQHETWKDNLAKVV